MTNELQTTLDNILEDKNTNLKPENLKQGVTVMGVAGTLEPGLDTSDATATTNDIIAPKTAYVNGGKITGTMSNNGELNYIPSTTQQSIPAGYTSGGSVSGDTNLIPENIKKDIQIFDVTGTYEGLDTSDADAIPLDIVAPKTAYVNGKKITGTLQGVDEFYPIGIAGDADNITLETFDETINVVTAEYTKTSEPTLLNGNCKITAFMKQSSVATAAGLTPEKIVSGNTILGVEGTATSLDTSDATATIKDILENKTAYVNGEKLTGTMANNGDLVVTPNTDEQDHSAGYYNSVQVRPVTATVDENIKAENIKSGVSILGVSGTVTELNGHELEVTPATEQKIITPEENYNAITKVTVDAVTSSIDSNIKPENIKKDISILGVTGTMESIDTSDATATADDIVVNKTAYVNGQKITGTIPTATTITEDGSVQLTSDGQFKASATVPNDIYLHSDITPRMIWLNLTKTQVADAIGLTADKIKAGETILGITGTYTGTSE